MFPVTKGPLTECLLYSRFREMFRRFYFQRKTTMTSRITFFEASNRQLPAGILTGPAYGNVFQNKRWFLHICPMPGVVRWAGPLVTGVEELVVPKCWKFRWSSIEQSSGRGRCDRPERNKISFKDRTRRFGSVILDGFGGNKACWVYKT